MIMVIWLAVDMLFILGKKVKGSQCQQANRDKFKIHVKTVKYNFWVIYFLKIVISTYHKTSKRQLGSENKKKTPEDKTSGAETNT